MCKSREEAQAKCHELYGHKNVARADCVYDDGHYYLAVEDLYWVDSPKDDDPGVLDIRSGAKPICQHTGGLACASSNEKSS